VFVCARVSEVEVCYGGQHLGLPTSRIAYYIVLSARLPLPRNEVLRDAYNSVMHTPSQAYHFTRAFERKKKRTIVTIVKVCQIAIYSYNQEANVLEKNKQTEPQQRKIKTRWREISDTRKGLTLK